MVVLTRPAARKSNSHVEGTYEYDALGRRTKKTLYDTSSVRYYHDGLHEVEEFDGSGSLLRKYVYREEIDSLAMMEAADVADVDNDQNTSELVRLYYHYDGRTNVARITGPAQTVVESYECDPYGNVTIKDKNGSAVPTTQVGNPFVFQRRRHDAETGLLYFRARHFAAGAGIWLQRDPLGIIDAPNLYEFCRTNPAKYRDPLGLQSVPAPQPSPPPEVPPPLRLIPGGKPKPTSGGKGGVIGFGLEVIIGTYVAAKELRESINALTEAQGGGNRPPIPPNPRRHWCLCTWVIKTEVACEGGKGDGFEEKTHRNKNYGPFRVLDAHECQTTCESKRQVEQAAQTEGSTATEEAWKKFLGADDCMVVVYVLPRGKGYVYT